MDNSKQHLLQKRDFQTFSFKSTHTIIKKLMIKKCLIRDLFIRGIQGN